MMDLRPSAETIGMALDVMGVTLYVLLAIWAAASRRHWFVRTCGVAAILLVVLVLPAHDLLIKFLIVQLIVVTGVTLWRWRQHRRRLACGATVDTSAFRPQLSLASIFLLTVVAAVVSAVAARFESFTSRQWLRIVLQGSVFGGSSLLCLWCVYARRPHWCLRWVLMVVCDVGLATILAFYRWALGLDGGTWQLAVLWWPYWIKHVAVWLIGLTLVLYAWRGSQWLPLSFDEIDAAMSSSRRRRLARVVFVLLLLLATVPPVYMFVRLLVRPPIPAVALPNPNGYDRLIKAGNTVVMPADLSVQLADADALRALLDSSRTALEELRIALHEPCLVPVNYQSRYGNDIETPIFRLARLLYYEQRLAELEGRNSDALNALLDGARLAEHITRGATESEWDVADAIHQYRPNDGALTIVNHLDAASCRRFARELQQIDANREPLEQIQRRTYIQRARDSNWGSRAAQVVNELAGETSEEDFLRGRYRLSELDLRRVIVVAAVKAYTLEHDGLPGQLQELVTEYLDDIPIDPFSTDSKPIQYEVTEAGYRLTNEPADSQVLTRKPLEIKLEAGVPVWQTPSLGK